MNDSSERYYICFAWRRGNRVHHWHWPKADIVNCTSGADVSKRDPEPPADPPSVGPSSTGWPS